MEFKVGQKYKIVDIDAWWDKAKYDYDGNSVPNGENFVDGEIVEVKLVDDCLAFVCGDIRSQNIDSLVSGGSFIKWCDSCIELLAETSTEPEDDTISIYHVADVLDDSIENLIFGYNDIDEVIGNIEKCVESLRQAGY